MKPSENFKTAIENYLNTTAQGDSVLAHSLAKETKNIESCCIYIFGEVKKTGLCAFDNQEIFDMAVKYYTDDSIGIPAPVSCRAVVQTPAKTDLFSQPEIHTLSSSSETIPQVKQEVKLVQTALTLFDL
ncbi:MULTISPECIES: Cas9 inhibitor AcrIIA9 family protein [Flavobacterium]|uniref:PcfK-like protein n=1 Tax=Flavobacterium cutihirudinis TaxID=1265740 RepID=A0A3D9G1A0_9FLAO|nr:MULTISPECIES: Cas9 inhibitor AcrIIA9 family protein [Flavobacterium]MBZ4040924.1 PcfK-like family protein [Flavobacterium hibisci]RED26988.1 PcfK-like protein [Flavobacterium cutihirudinis]